MKSREKKINLLRNEKVSIALLKLGIPTMIGMMTAALYNLVDSYFVGKLGTSQMGAISIVYPLGVIILGIGLLFGSGASSYLARLLGNNQYKEADQCASTAIFLSMLTALVLIVGMLLFMNPLLRALGATDTMLPHAREYAIPFIIGLVFNVFNITYNNIITSEGASFYSMLAMLIGGCVNMILDPILILALNMGIQGAGIATLLSRMISTGIYLCYLCSKKSNYHISIRMISFENRIIMEILKIGIPMLIYQGLCFVALTLTNHFAAFYGDFVVAAFGIVNRMISLFVMILMGFLKGYQPFIGYNYTAGKEERVKEATKTVMIWTSIFCIVAVVIMILGRYQLIELFSKEDEDVIKVGTKILIVNAITFLGMGYQTVHSFRFMGLGKAKEGGLISIGRQGIFFIPIILVLTYTMGLNGIILSQPLADICSMFLVFMLVKGNKKDDKRIVSDEIIQ